VTDLAIGLGLLVILMVNGVPVAMAFGAMALYLATVFDMGSAVLIPTAF
jgi:hypothetical protein